MSEGDEWRHLRNVETDNITQGEEIVRFIKSSKISWLGHVDRMPLERQPKQLIAKNIEGTRRRGRHRQRWVQELVGDLRMLGVQNRRQGAREIKGSIVNEL